MATSSAALAEVWTVSIVLRSDSDQTRADASLLGHSLNWKAAGGHAPHTNRKPSREHNLAAAEALRRLSHQRRARASTVWGRRHRHRREAIRQTNRPSPVVSS